MTIREVLQVTCSTYLIFSVLNCCPTLISASSVVAPISVGLQKQETDNVCCSPTQIGATTLVAPIRVGLRIATTLKK